MKFNWHVGPYATLQSLTSVICWQETSQTVDVCCPSEDTQREHACWGLRASCSPPLSCSRFRFMLHKINSQIILHLLLTWQHTHLTDVPMKIQQRKGRDIDSGYRRFLTIIKAVTRIKITASVDGSSLVRRHISPWALIDLDTDKLQPQAPEVLAQ